MKEKCSKTLLLFILTSPIFHSTIFCQSGLVKTVYFKSNSFTIEEKYKPALDSIAKQINFKTLGFLRVFGFADTTGSEDYNDDLSGKRAEAVYNYLAARAKIDSARVYVDWIGESKDAYDLHFPSAHIQQRCVDVWLVFRKKDESN